MRLEKSLSSERGFSLAETLVAVGILATVAMGVAQLFAYAAGANQAAKAQTSAASLAAQKMEQLRELTWGFDKDGLGLPVTDTTTNLSTSPATAAGRGLNPSPASTLDQNVAGYFDYLRTDGSWVGNADPAPADAQFVRRWSIEPLPTNPNNTLVLQVMVTTVVREAARNPASPKQRVPGDAWITTVKTRKAM
ncbi:MAG TPA: prepilin-type N-terminal cleavage/methylation domain-containing protein [Vicinamibacterales bacterium]|nr:prepilin-type N-terminal cleavage/methylation domain-containing protein [Vicinamibacterales bacterium]